MNTRNKTANRAEKFETLVETIAYLAIIVASPIYGVLAIGNMPIV